MKNKLNYLTEQSLNKKIKTKWFKVVNIILAVLIVGIINVDRIINAFGGNFNKQKTIFIVSDANIYDELESSFSKNAEYIKDIGKYEMKKANKKTDELINNLNDNTYVLNVSISDSNIINATVYSFNPLSTIETQLLKSSLNSVKYLKLIKDGALTEEQIRSLQTDIELENEIKNPKAKGENAKDLVASGIITIFIVPIFILIVLLVQMIGAEINDEKTTRGMEIIISSVPVKYHFISKIKASLKYVLIQGGLILSYAFIGIIIRLILNKIGGSVLLPNEIASSLNDVINLFRNSGVISNFLIVLPIILVLIFTAFLTYSILASVLASMTTSIEDYQQLQTPLMLIMVAGYYLALMGAVFDGSLFIKIVAYIPMLSFMVAPSLYLLGNMHILELIVSTIISILFLVFVYIFGLRIYKEGILNYSSSNLWKKIFKSMKKNKE